MSRRVVITGLGFITCIGNGREEVLHSLRTLKSGIGKTEFLDNPNQVVKAAGKPPDFDLESTHWRHWKIPPGYAVDPGLQRSLSPQGMYAICALEQALVDGGVEKETLKDGGTGLYCASVGSPRMLHHYLTGMIESRGERTNPLAILSSIAGTLNFNLGSWLGIRGSNCGYVSACTSGSHAVGHAWDDIILGRQNRALVLGAEDATAETLLPFAAMRALSTNPDVKKASRPFDIQRDGFVGAGGATVVILEEKRFAMERGAKVYAELTAWGQASDGYHRASPQPEGLGLVEAMKRTLKDGGIEPADIDHICAHATSTPVGDKAEACAIGNLFRTCLDAVTVSSPKGITGHGLSMAGLLELAICCLMMREQFVLGNANLEEVDPDCKHLSLPLKTESASLTWILNNSSGFGGSNVCNLLKRYD